MMEHFNRRNSPLRCVQHYPTVQDHHQRFLNLGCNRVYVKTIHDIWKRFVGDTEGGRLAGIETFDEVPELMLKCLHYVLIVGIKTLTLTLPDFWQIGRAHV